MNSFRNWLHNVGSRFTTGIRHFMMGRYGTDKLNTVILSLGVLLCVIGMLVRSPAADLVLMLGAYGLMGWAIFRSLSRNTYKRYQENRRFLSLLQRLKDREHRYYDCPRCHQQIRVPRGKGKIAITCPKCGERFIRKT